MDKKIAAKWTKALRSGKYKQTTQRLKDENGYCCLGVLCDLYFKENKTKPSVIKNVFKNFGTLPDYIREWADMYSTDGEFINRRKRGRFLTQYNDGIQGGKYKRDFNYIAKIIDANVDRL